MFISIKADNILGYKEKITLISRVNLSELLELHYTEKNGVKEVHTFPDIKLVYLCGVQLQTLGRWLPNTKDQMLMQ